MSRLFGRRDGTVDPPTVHLTAAEREAFGRLAATYEWRRRVRHRLLSCCNVRRSSAGVALWLGGAAWIVCWLTTNPVVSALGAVPFQSGMWAVVTHPALTRRTRTLLRRVLPVPAAGTGRARA